MVNNVIPIICVNWKRKGFAYLKKGDRQRADVIYDNMFDAYNGRLINGSREFCGIVITSSLGWNTNQYSLYEHLGGK